MERSGLTLICGLRLGDGLVHARDRLRLGEPAHETARFVDIGLRQEGELGDALRLDVRLHLGGHRDAAGNGACDGAQLAHVALQEAPAGGRVEGEGLALQVVTAGGLAGFEVDVFAHVVIGAEIIRAFGDDEPPLLGNRCGGRERRGSASSNEEIAPNTARMVLSLAPAFLEGASPTVA